MLGNREQIAVAVSNLVANAVAYSPEGSTVVVSATGRGEAVDLSVTDRGIGIPPHELERIFERFYRVDPARHRSTGGTGLGLSIVKHVAASHGGEVRVWSVEGQGSTFTLTLPRKPWPLAARDAVKHANVVPETEDRSTASVRDIRMFDGHPTKENNTP